MESEKSCGKVHGLARVGKGHFFQHIQWKGTRVSEYESVRSQLYEYVFFA